MEFDRVHLLIGPLTRPTSANFIELSDSCVRAL